MHIPADRPEFEMTAAKCNYLITKTPGSKMLFSALDNTNDNDNKLYA